jgi:FkbM family methyltransferase
MVLRTVLERLSRGRILKRRLPSRFGRIPIFVSPDARLQYLKYGEGAFDAALLRLASEQVRNDSVIWDIGANCGVFAFAAASIAIEGEVLAVEADPWLSGLLSKSAGLQENAHLKVKVLSAAISDRIGKSTFLIANRGRASNSLEESQGRSQASGSRERIEVPVLTLDSLLDKYSRPTVIKIDIEGAEGAAMRGAGKILRDVRPIIHIETGNESADEVTDHLRRNNYFLFDADREHDRQSLTRCVFNTLAIPEEQLRG